jgi:hypothetical protein
MLTNMLLTSTARHINKYCVAYTERKKEKREKKCKCPKSKFIYDQGELPQKKKD